MNEKKEYKPNGRFPMSRKQSTRGTSTQEKGSEIFRSLIGSSSQLEKPKKAAGRNIIQIKKNKLQNKSLERSSLNKRKLSIVKNKHNLKSHVTNSKVKKRFYEPLRKSIDEMGDLSHRKREFVHKLGFKKQRLRLRGNRDNYSEVQSFYSLPEAVTMKKNENLNKSDHRSISALNMLPYEMEHEKELLLLQDLSKRNDEYLSSLKKPLKRKQLEQSFDCYMESMKNLVSQFFPMEDMKNISYFKKKNDEPLFLNKRKSNYIIDLQTPKTKLKRSKNMAKSYESENINYNESQNCNISSPKKNIKFSLNSKNI